MHPIGNEISSTHFDLSLPTGIAARIFPSLSVGSLRRLQSCGDRMGTRHIQRAGVRPLPPETTRQSRHRHARIRGATIIGLGVGAYDTRICGGQSALGLNERNAAVDVEAHLHTSGASRRDGRGLRGSFDFFQPRSPRGRVEERSRNVRPMLLGHATEGTSWPSKKPRRKRTWMFASNA